MHFATKVSRNNKLSKSNEMLARTCQSQLPVSSDSSVRAWSKNDYISGILVPTNMRAWANRDFTLKTTQVYFLFESTHQSRSTNTTATITRAMRTYKNIWTFKSFWSSRMPLNILHKHFFNKCVYIKVSQSPACLSKINISIQMKNANSSRASKTRRKKNK